MDELYLRIRSRREELGLSQDELAKKMGYVSRSSINKIELGKNDIPQAKIIAFAKALDTTPAWLMGWTDISKPKDDEKIEGIDYIRVPVLGKVAAGVPIESIEDVVDFEDLSLDMFNSGKEYFGLKVEGDSMYPDYKEGDTVIVQKTETCETGNICVVYVNGYDATLKQVKMEEDGGITLIPFNREYPPKTYTKKEVTDLPVAICGIVKQLRRDV